MAYVNIVTSDRGWILENLATQISSRLPYVQFGGGLDAGADIQYYMTYSVWHRRSSPIEIGYYAHLEPEGEAYEKFFNSARQVDHCICHAKLYEAVLRDHGITNVSTIAPGVDAERFQPKLRIGVVGRTYHTGRKGEHVVAQVMDIPEIEWSFTGDGWPEPALHLPDADMPDFYRGLDYVLVPALYEGGPMCVVEALACGTEVIAPPVGWVPEFPHAEFEVGNAQDLRRVLLELIEKKRALRETVLSRTWDAWAEGHDRVFSALAAKHNLSLAKPAIGKRAEIAPTVGLLLHGSEGTSPGGPSTRVPRLARELREWGIDAKVQRHPGTDLANFDVVHAFNVWAPKSALDLIKRAKSEDRGVVFSPIFLDLSMRPLWQDRLPEIFTHSDGEAELDRRLERFRLDCIKQRAQTSAPPEAQPGYYASVRAMMAQSDHAIFLSERERQRLAQIGADVSRGSVVHNPVDTEVFANGDAALFEAEYGVKDFILCVARQEARKNQLMLIRALQGTNIPLVLVGHRANAHYCDLMDRYRTPNVHIIERLPPNSPMLAAAFAASRVAVLASWAEGAPLAALEAAASGTSLVLSDESGESEYFGHYARYCDPGSVADIRSKLLEAYETTRTPEAVEEQKRFIAETFSWDRHREATLDVYRAVAQKKAEARAALPASPVNDAPAVIAPDKKLDIVFDVTTSANHKGRWTGIARVEAAIGLALNESPRVGKVHFVAWNNKAQQFVEIPYDAMRSGKTRNVLGHYDAAPIRPLKLPKGAPYIMAGSGWMQNVSYVEGLVAFKHRYDLKLTPIIHDLIPIKFPFWFDDGYAPVFVNNLSVLLGNSDSILAISEHTALDIREFATSTLDMFIPPIRTFREGDEIAQIQTKTELPKDVEALTDQPFILAVGAIHSRKNHRLLYDVWIKLREKMGGRCPKLIIVGGIAWNGKDLARSLQMDKRINKHILILEHIDDHALEWLYQNCLFTVYPSLYEGWGLPVSESLRYGKFCIASNSSSIPEIAPDFVELLDPLDTSKWLASIQFYASSRRALAQREAKIAESYKPFTWAESAATIVDDLLTTQDAAVAQRLYVPGTLITLANRADGARHKREGWHLTEKWGAWSSELRARLQFTIDAPIEGDALFIAEVKGFPFPGRSHEARIVVNGHSLGRWVFFNDKPVIRHVTIPSTVIDGAKTIDVVIENATLTPIAQVSKSQDHRSVGLGVGRCLLAAAEAVEDASTYGQFPLPEPQCAKLNKHLDFFKDTASRALLEGQWAVHSAWGAYNSDMRPRISFVAHQAPGRALTVDLGVRPVASEDNPLTVIVLVNDMQNSTWNFTDDQVQQIRIEISPEVRDLAQPITIDLVPSDHRSPKEVGVGEFETPLPFGLFTMRVTSPGLPGAEGTIASEAGERLRFSSRVEENQRNIDYLPGTWHGVEANGVWSAGRSGTITLALEPGRHHGFIFRGELRVFAPAGEKRSVDFLINDRLAWTEELDRDSFHKVEFPFLCPEASADGLVRLEIRAPEGSSPYKLGEGADERLLGVRIGAMSLEPVVLFGDRQVVSFARTEERHDGEGADYVEGGWFPPERAGRWSRSDEGRLSFRLASRLRRPRLFMAVRTMGATRQTPAYVDLLLNGTLLDTWVFEDEDVVLAEVRGFARAAASDKHTKLQLRRRDAVSPRELGKGGDSRRLGVLVSGMTLVADASPEEAASTAADLLVAKGIAFRRAYDPERVAALYGEALEIERADIETITRFNEPTATRRVFSLSRDADTGNLLELGWFTPEDRGTWSMAREAKLRVPVTGGRVAAVELLLRVVGTTAAGPALIALEGVGSEQRFLLRDDGYRRVVLPVGPELEQPAGGFTVTLRRLGAVTPRQVDLGKDDRPLGAMVHAIAVVEAPKPPEDAAMTTDMEMAEAAAEASSEGAGTAADDERPQSVVDAAPGEQS